MGIVKQQWLEEMDEEDREDPLYIADCARIGDNRRKLFRMTNDEYEFRYERRGDVYLIKRWHNGTEWTDRGNTDNVPVWLVPILVVAKVSGHLRKTNVPPPDEILWFRTDKNHQLTTFIDLEDARK
jgi:hypothetical protein